MGGLQPQKRLLIASGDTPHLIPQHRFSPFRRVTFSLRVQRESNQRENTPGIRVWRLRHQTSLATSPFQGPAYKGHPSPFTPLAASLPPIPFHVDSTRPPDGTRSQPARPCIEQKADFEKPEVAARLRAKRWRFGRATVPVRRPSAGVVEGDARQGARLKGPRRPL